MSHDVVDALILLDNMRAKALKSTSGSYRIERIEQAMDYLLNTPLKQGNPKTIVRDVLGSAGSKIRNRINVIKEASEMAGIASLLVTNQTTNDYENFKLEVTDEISRTALNKQIKAVLVELASGKDAVDLAEGYNTSVKAMRTRVSKARKAYKKELGLAL